MNTRTTLILALCLAVVGLYMAFIAKPWKEPTKQAEPPKPQDIWAEKPKQEDVERIEVVSSRDPKRVFVKSDDKWLIEEPVKATATKSQVDDIIRELVDLKCVTKYEKNAKGRPSDATTKLDAPFYTVTLKAKGGKTYAIKIGQRTPTGGDTYVQKPGSDDILVADKNLHEKLAKRLSELRDKRVTDFKTEEAVRVTVVGAGLDVGVRLARRQTEHQHGGRGRFALLCDGHLGPRAIGVDAEDGVLALERAGLEVPDGLEHVFDEGLLGDCAVGVLPVLT